MSTDSVALTQTTTPPPRSTVAGTMHTVVLLIIITAWAAWGYFGAVRMRTSSHPRRAAMYILTILWEWSLVVYIAWGARRHGISMSELIGGKWRSAMDFFKDIAIAAGFWIIALAVLVSTAIALHASNPSQSVRFMIPQNRLEIFLWILTSLTAGICEEIIFRGYFQRQFSAWTGNIVVGLLLSAAVFGAGHIYQGGKSPIIIMVFGVLFGILAELRKSLRPGMMVHAWHDAITGLLARLVRT